MWIVLFPVMWLFCRTLYQFPRHINTQTHPAFGASYLSCCLRPWSHLSCSACLSCVSDVNLRPLVFFTPCHVSFPPRHQPWLLARLSACSSTSTVLWWLSASVPLRGAGEAGFKRWSAPSSSPDPPSLIASRMNLLHEFPLFCYVPLAGRHSQLVVLLQYPYISSRKSSEQDCP